VDPAIALRYARANRSRLVRDLRAFIGFPSVSSEASRRQDVARCASWLSERLRAAGFDAVRVVPTSGHPLVMAEWDRLPGFPTVMVYGHYDVQPPGSASAWRTPPFTGVSRGEHLHGRGASDDKGPLIAHVLAIESWLRGTGRLPVNLRCVFDGEEEVGSPGLRSALGSQPSRFRADAAVMSDTRIPSPERPAVTYALRGSIGMEVQVGGGPVDLHSGAFGGAVEDPLETLCEVVASLHDTHGIVEVPGFYRRVRAWAPEELAFMARNGPGDLDYLRAAGGAPAAPRPGTTLYERSTIYPALTVTGVAGGHAGPGVGAIIPHAATAKLNVRIVPDQVPAEVAAAIRDHIVRSVPPEMRVGVRVRSASGPVVVDRSHPVVTAAASACRWGFGADPVFLRSGGTIPVVELLVRKLDTPVAMIGMALQDDRMHAPNERAHLPTLYRGVDTAIWFLHEIGRQVAARRAPLPATGALA
jgi:acetylornithine deacetylase/succinyl-diaminopimelate desuccinylase-like protein